MGLIQRFGADEKEDIQMRSRIEDRSECERCGVRGIGTSMVEILVNEDLITLCRPCQANLIEKYRYILSASSKEEK